MNRLEAHWLADHLAHIPDRELFPMLNVGSSTAKFRSEVQPYIDELIFKPMRMRGGRVIHVDIKPADGVDIVGDLLDPSFLAEIAKLKVRSIMVSNLFEHVSDRGAICEVLMRILPSDGYLIVSGPRDYPYHADPIDTMFRPTVVEMHRHFPGTKIVDSAIIDSGNWRQWDCAERGRPLNRTILRLLTPFYRPVKWYELARQSAYIFKHITAFGVILRKEAIDT